MKVFLIGDSTMQYNSALTYPQTGWGQVLHMFLDENIQVVNLAKNGSSTKSFKEEKRFDYVIKNIAKGDYVICQFGHNDQSVEKTKKYTTHEQYVENLDYYTNKVKELGGTMIMVTSIARLKFEDDVCVNSHGIYPQLMKVYAQKEGLTCIDLNDITIKLYNKIGYQATKKYFMIFNAGIYENYPDGLNDHTHLVYEGAQLITTLFIKEIKKHDEQFAKLLLV